MQTDTQIAGRELNIQIALKVFGLAVGRWGDTDVVGKSPGAITVGYATPLDDYSGHIATAWQVVEKMRERYGELFTLNWYAEANKWEATFYMPAGHGFYGQAEAETAPLAISLAALEAIGEPK